MSEEMALTHGADGDARTMVAQVKNRLAAVRELLRSELKGPTTAHPEGVDYGIVPGTKKLVLFQPGAEKIAMMFSFTPSYTITRTDLPGGHREVTALCTLTHSASGRIVGQCAGSASTMESKHRYRGAAGKACPECGAMACIPSKKEYGGGYFCKEANGGCGKKWKPGTPECAELDSRPAMKQENPDPADQWNTVDKIAQKRAYVGAVKGASAASEVFTVDMEDATPADEPTREPVKMPTATPPKKETSAPKPEAKPATAEPTDGELVAIGPLEVVSVKESKPDAAKPWKKWGCKVNGEWYGTFDSEIGEFAETLKGDRVRAVYTTDAKGYHNLSEIGAAMEDEGNTQGGVTPF